MHKTIEDWTPINSKCPRCSLCKFPPLMVVESQEFSQICPSYREFGFHSYSGGGKVVLAMSLDQGRGELTPEALQSVYACTMCGGCDMSCKYSSDIEVSEMMYALRAEAFSRCGPHKGHKNVLEDLARIDKGAWMKKAGIKAGTGRGDILLYVGDRYAANPDKHATIAALYRLLQSAGVKVRLLGKSEPSTGRQALDMGDQASFDHMIKAALAAVRHSGATTIVCADALDLNAFTTHGPKVADISGLSFVPAVTVLADLMKKKKLVPRKPFPANAVYHDPCNLGRLNEAHIHWDGEIKKIMGQLVIYDPPRPVNRGAGGCYEPPRDILKAIPGLDLGEFERRREYAFCCGGGGLVQEAGYNELAANSSQHRIDEAKSAKADTIITACPNCVSNLAATGEKQSMRVLDIIDVLAEAVL